uniref:ATP synthase F0 subunit 8 n=1 Tax=Archaeocroton sphenodonti TaxID=2599316 RepID=H9M776_9ACAR|nr:ATP synthase F0 subunit 8 [Archaeocroton sphenodonti]AET63093.1 ATP synthase F0 subunit 8 [Archaeocroton sphenodonti]
MPQLFPMNWALISTMIMISLFMITTNTFFIKFLKQDKKLKNYINNKKLSFKW